MSFHAIRSLLKFELRQLRRERTRLLVAAILIVIPVASLVAVGTIVGIIEPSVEEKTKQQLGHADFAVRGVESESQLVKTLALLGSSSKSQLIFRGVDEVSVNGRTIGGAVLAVDPESDSNLGLSRGIVEIVSGRFPRNSGEVALSPALAGELSVTLEDSVCLTYGARRKVVGLAMNPEEIDGYQIVRTRSLVERGGSLELLVQYSSSSSDAVLEQLRGEGVHVVTSSEIRAESDGFTLGFVFVCSWIGFFEAALIIGASHAIAYKRRQREFGLIASIGGHSRQLLAALLLSTLGFSFLISIGGCLVGCLLAGILHPFLDGWTNRINGAFEVSGVFLAGAVALGVTSSVLAVLYPAWKSSRLTVREALLSFRPENRSSLIAAIFGWGLFGICGLLFFLTEFTEVWIGPIRLLLLPLAFLIAIAVLSPTLIRFGFFFRGFGSVIQRLAIQDTSRFRSRSAIAVVAVFAAMSVAVAAAIVTASLQATLDRFPAKLRSDQILLNGPNAGQVAGQLKKLDVCLACSPLLAAYSNGQPLRVGPSGSSRSSIFQQWIAIGDEELLRCFAIQTDQAKFQSGALISIDSPTLEERPLVSTWVNGTQVPLKEVIESSPSEVISGPLFFLNSTVAADAGIQTGPPPNRGAIAWIVRFAKPVDDSILELVQAVVKKQPGTMIESQRNKSRALRYASLAAQCVSNLMGIIVVLCTLALNFTESRDEFRILFSLGTAKSQRRKLIATRAWYLTLIGCLLAIPCGTILADSMLSATNFETLWIIPWWEMGGVVLLTPCLVGIVASLVLAPWKSPKISNVETRS